MKRSKGENGETQMSWLTKLFERLFVTKERTNKALKRSFSFRSRHIQTRIVAEKNGLINENNQKPSSSEQILDPKIFQTDIIRSR